MWRRSVLGIVNLVRTSHHNRARGDEIGHSAFCKHLHEIQRGPEAKEGVKGDPFLGLKVLGVGFKARRKEHTAGAEGRMPRERQGTKKAVDARKRRSNTRGGKSVWLVKRSGP